MAFPRHQTPEEREGERMIIWTCVTCNHNCEREVEDEFEDPWDFPLQGEYCPYMDEYTKWVRDDDQEVSE